MATGNLATPSPTPTINMPYLTPEAVAQNRALMDARLAMLEQQMGPQTALNPAFSALSAAQPALQPGLGQLSAGIPQLAAGTPALAAGTPALTQAGVVNATRAAAATAPLELTAGTPPLLGGNYAAPGANVTAAAESAGASPGLLGRLGAQLKGEVGELLPEGGLLSKAGGFIGAHPGLARAGAGIAAIAAAQPAQDISNKLGAPKEVGGAIHGGLEWGGTALTVPGVGPVLAPLAAIVGAGYGAVAEPLKDLYAVDHYEDYANKFHKDAYSKQLAGTQLNHHYFVLANQIHHGEGSITDKALALQRLNAMMGNARQAIKQGLIDPNDKSTWDGSGKVDKKSSQDKKRQAAVQIQMGEAMAKLGANSTARGIAEQQMLNNLANDPNMAAIAPVLRNDGQQRADFGQQTADAYTGAAYGDLQAQSQKSMMSTIAQLEQQLTAARLQAASSSGGGSTSLADQANAILKRVGS